MEIEYKGVSGAVYVIDEEKIARDCDSASTMEDSASRSVSTDMAVEELYDEALCL